MKRRVLFYRTWTAWDGGTSGGHLKVLDAFQHLKNSPFFEPFVFFPPKTIWHDNPGNYWLPYRHLGLTEWSFQPGDVLFLSGKDWEILAAHPAHPNSTPILNIVQPRHTAVMDPRNQYLKNRAIRIVKSKAGKDILSQHGVNGPLVLIPDAIDPDSLPLPNHNPRYNWVIVGLKNEPLARKMEHFFKSHPSLIPHFPHIKIQYPPKLPTRSDFLQLINDASAVLFLPNPAERGFEGFYLPALEAMALGKLVVCPDVTGNRDFCIDGWNCFKPEYSEQAIQQALLAAVSMAAEHSAIMRQRAIQTSMEYHIREERQAYLTLLEQIDDIWNDQTLYYD